MRQHAMDLLERHEICYVWCDRPTRAWASRAEEVQIAHMKSAISYATALHEIGRRAASVQQSSMVRERWAWCWARERERERERERASLDRNDGE
jgi:hypothetical protein